MKGKVKQTDYHSILQYHVILFGTLLLTQTFVLNIITTEGKHGTRVIGKKDILTKSYKDSVQRSRAYYPVVSNIGSHTRLHTSSTPAKTCGDLGINNKTPNRMLTRQLPHTKCINVSPRIRLHASIRLKIRKKEK